MAESYTLIEEEAIEAETFGSQEDRDIAEALNQSAQDVVNLMTPEERVRMMAALCSHRD